MPNAPSRRIRESRGNAVVLVLCCSAYAEHALLPESVFAALGHFGIAYRVRDLARGRLRAGELADCAAAIIGQENLGLALSAADQKTLLGAVEGGLGLVNLDYNLAHYDAGLAEALGVRGTRNDKAVGVAGARAVGIVTTDDFLTYTQESGRVHGFQVPVPAAVVRARRGKAKVVAETDLGSPAVLHCRLGRGRIVQWLVSPRIWTLQVFGHAHGLDDLFWKGIVWTARKPFAMHCMPPFVRFRFDDCNGLYRTPRDMAFVQVLNAYGHKPNMCVCMNALKPQGWRMLKMLFDQDKVEVAPHTWKGGVSLFYGQGGEEYSAQRFRELIGETAAMLKRHRITPSRILSDHEHETSARVLPFLKRLGIHYKMNVMLPGETWAGRHVDWRPAPYGSMSYALDYTPGPTPLFVVFNHYPSFDAARSYLTPKTFLLNRAGGYGDHMWDFLNGLTTRDRRTNDVAGMADRLVEHTRLGLNSLFFGGSISHSHFTAALGVGEWRALLDRYERRTERMEKLNVGYDDVADYARAKFHTRLTAAERLDGGMKLRLAGSSEVPLRLSMFTETDGVPERHDIPVEPFTGRREIRV